MHRTLTFRRMAGGIAVLLAAPCVGAQPSCDVYAVEGLRAGASVKQVRAVLGGEGNRVTVDRSAWGEYSTAQYQRPGGAVYVEYDGVVGRSKPVAVLVEQQTHAAVVSAPAFAQSLIERFGSPAMGADNLATGLVEGPAHWIDRTCGVAVSASYRPAAWWNPSEGAYFSVQLRELRHVEALASSGDARFAWLATLPALRTPATAATATAPAMRNSPAVVDTTTAPGPRKADAAPAATDGAPAPSSSKDSKPPVAPAAVATPVVVAQNLFVEPVRIPASYVQPLLPSRARGRALDAEVTLELEVLPDGTVGEVTVRDSTRPGLGLEQASVTAVRRWRYEPARSNGVPVRDVISVVINFR